MLEVRSDRISRQAPVVNVHHENDARFSMQLCRWVLKPIGMWPFVYGPPTGNDKIVSAILILISLAFLCFVMLPSGRHIIFRERDIYTQLKLIGPVLYCLAATLKYIFLGLRSKAFTRCIRHMEVDWRMVRDGNHRNIMLKNAALGRKFIKGCMFFLYVGGLAYHSILPLSAAKKINGSYVSRPHTYAGYDIFFDPEATPAYEIVLCIHCLYAVVTYNITTSAYGLSAVFVAHSCGQAQILIDMLDDLVDGKNSKGTTVGERLKVITRQHVRALKFSANVEDVLREIFLIEILDSTILISLVEYYLIREWENSDIVGIVTYAVLLISFPVNILIYCYIGEMLMDQYSQMGSAAYGINWYDLSGNKAANLVMMIVMSHHPPKLTAGKFCDLTINTFGIVMKTSMVYLNLVRKTATD